MSFIDITNQRFGRLVAVERLLPPSGHEAKWSCICDCGGKAFVRVTDLRRGRTTSCGCYFVERRRVAALRHGHASKGEVSPTYKIWNGMLARCTNPRVSHYENYGGRGIRVCERWRSFANFLADMGERPSINHSIDRRDVDGHYEPGNCRWATQAEQRANRRDAISPLAIALIRHMRRRRGRLTDIAHAFGIAPPMVKRVAGDIIVAHVRSVRPYILREVG
jgi:hypothetical protein